MISVRNLRPVTICAVAVTVAGILIPPIFAWFVLGRAPGVTVPEARNLLLKGSSLLVTVDPDLAERLPGAEVWLFESIMKTRDASGMPNSLKDSVILLICKGGIQSSRAALHLRRIGFGEAFSVRGGYQEWITQPNIRRVGWNVRLDTDAVKSVPSFRPSPLYEQWAAVLTFFGVKLVYSALAALIAILIWREKAADMIALRRSMIAFFIGEGFCFVNVVVFGDHILLFEHLHSAGMVVSAAFFAYAVLEGLDSRFIHFSDESRCAATGLCRACFKHADVPCGLRRAFLVFVPLLGVIAVLPLFSPLRGTAYNTLILGTLYGYRHPIVHQLYELRYLPAAAVVLLACCFLTLLLMEHRRVQLSKILFSAALGAMAFSFFRLLLVAVFIEKQVWFASWEETSELIYILFAGCVLFLFPRIAPSADRFSHISRGRSLT